MTPLQAMRGVALRSNASAQVRTYLATEAARHRRRHELVTAGFVPLVVFESHQNGWRYYREIAGKLWPKLHEESPRARPDPRITIDARVPRKLGPREVWVPEWLPLFAHAWEFGNFFPLQDRRGPARGPSSMLWLKRFFVRLLFGDETARAAFEGAYRLGGVEAGAAFLEVLVRETPLARRRFVRGPTC